MRQTTIVSLWKPFLWTRSEIRLAGDGDVVVEQVLVVLGANLLGHPLLHPPIAADPPPRLIERVRVLHGDRNFQCLALLDHSPALDHMQLGGMRGAIIVHERLVVHAYGIDDK